MEIHDSARKHGVADEDILHAIDHALAIEDAGEDPDRWLLIGPDSAGNLLEVVVVIHDRGDAAGDLRYADARQIPKAPRTMTKPRVHGHTKSGRPVTDEDVEKLAAETEAGYDVETLIARRNKRGRRTIGATPASVESVRLDPELRRQLLERAEADGTTPSELIREALRRYFRAA